MPTNTQINSQTPIATQIGGIRKGNTYTTPNRNVITITGTGGDKAKHAPIVACLAWCLDRLQVRNMEIALRMGKKCEGKFGILYSGTANNLGEWGKHRDQVHAMNGRWFKAEVDIATQNDLEQIISTVAHEAIHVWQYHKGSIVRADDVLNGHLWTGNAAFGKHGHYSQTTTDYKNLPWERQAYAMQGEIAAQYTESQGTTRVRQSDRWATGWQPKAKTVAKFGNAIANAVSNGQQNDAGEITVTLADIAAGGLGACWLKTAHGWSEGKSCQNNAMQHGYRGILDRTDKANPVVVLHPQGATVRAPRWTEA